MICPVDYAQMKKSQKLKLIIIAVGIILSTAFYVLGGSFREALRGDNELIVLGDSGNQALSAGDEGTGADASDLAANLSVAGEDRLLSASGTGSSTQSEAVLKLLSESYAGRLSDELYTDASGRGYLSDALKAELKSYIREAVREELVAICEEGYLERAVNEAAAVAAAEQERKAGLVNINTADAAGLQSLDGIGEKRAADIIAYRDAHGAFGSIEDIMQVSGIKQSAYDKIKDKICT